MKREIKFRGLREDGKGWVYGYYGVDSEDRTVIVYNENYSIEPDLGIVGVKSVSHFVTPESVGQFTGLQDKNGVDIYESDKLFWNGQGIGVVKMGESGKIYARGEECYIEYSSFKKCELIGNIHETK